VGYSFLAIRTFDAVGQVEAARLAQLAGQILQPAAGHGDGLGAAQQVALLPGEQRLPVGRVAQQAVPAGLVVVGVHDDRDAPPGQQGQRGQPAVALGLEAMHHVGLPGQRGLHQS
ncbi:hypothetical protein RZS08_45120, partial [Arthrospira platensis SPKY1]|nr:hypothetical protein [Arthrospira platensis SPKY1]